MNDYAWRSCAGRTSDAIQFAAQMGFASKINGAWHLDLPMLLRFFGGEDQPKIARDNEQSRVSTILWDGDFEIELIANLVPIEEKATRVSHARVNLSIVLTPLYGARTKKTLTYDMPADRRGVEFYCVELGGSLCAAQLMQILAVIGRAMDEHTSWRYFNEMM